MPGRKKQPVNLVVLKGKSHLTKAEIEERRDGEIDVPADAIRAPDFLTKAQAAEFDRIAAQLVGIGIMTNLDCDTLGAYLCARDEWIRAGKDYDAIRRGKTVDEMDLKGLSTMSGIRDRAFKQAMRCASELGLTITSRCKLVAPKQEEKPVNKFARFGSG